MPDQEQPGLVLVDFGSQVEVQGEDGHIRRLIHFPSQLHPAVGDRVWYHDQSLVRIEERKNLLARFKPNGDWQVMAANLDEVWLLLPLDREPSQGRLSRFAHFAQSQGFSPLVLLTKADLAPSPQAHISLMVSSGLDFHLVSMVTGQGLEYLQARLAEGKRALLLGQSGVGKSSLANALAQADLTTGAVREADHRGRHTTVTRRLIPLATGGALVDIPGFRELAWEEQDRLPAAWEELAQACRYSDCSHSKEPGCALQEAVARGELPEEALAQWRKLQKEAAFQIRREDKAESANSKKRWRQIHKNIRARSRFEGW